MPCNNVLRTLRDLNPNRLIVVFGCGGDRDRAKRPLMGHAAEQGSDHAIITSDNPRSENPEAILQDIEKGFQGRNFEKIVDRALAIQRAISMAQSVTSCSSQEKGTKLISSLPTRPSPSTTCRSRVPPSKARTGGTRIVHEPAMKRITIPRRG